MGKRAAWLTAALLISGGALDAAAECTASEEPLLKRGAAVQTADTLPQWGYGYAKLKEDLAEWDKSPYVTVDSIGSTVQGRAIWSVNITEGEDSIKTGEPGWRKRRVFVHARTHPSEVQAHQVAVAMIRFLLDTTAQARDIRKEFVFNIVPMYNPDGVELMHPRENANKIDIESNWNKPVLEPEVQALKRHFQFLMAGALPVEIALNLHSDQFNCTRFFFFHEAGGTSPAYVELEKDFIGKVRGHFQTGIEEWHFIRSWATATGTQYPEGFWWLNHKEKVMALTYEDANCPTAGQYDSTGRALVLGSVDYLLPKVASLKSFVRQETRLLRVPGGWRVQDRSGLGYSAWSLRDAAGRLLDQGRLEKGGAHIPMAAASGRMAVLRLTGAAQGREASLLLPSAAP